MSNTYQSEVFKAISEGFTKLYGTRADTIIMDDITENKMTRKFAPVAPIHIYEALANRGYTPHNILLLAHDVVKEENAARYNKLFTGVWSDTNIIMDNSAIELGKSVDVPMVVDAVEIVNANIAILPDALTDGVESAALTLSSFDKMKTALLDYDVELLAVLQGETIQGFLQGCQMIQSIAQHIDWISIPRRTESKFGYHRNELIGFAQNFFVDHKIHLLGFSNYPWEDLRAAQNANVQSIDSAAPLRCTVDNFMISTGGSRVTDGNDWWDTCTYSDNMLKVIEAVDNYINL